MESNLHFKPSEMIFDARQDAMSSFNDEEFGTIHKQRSLSTESLNVNLDDPQHSMSNVNSSTVIRSPIKGERLLSFFSTAMGAVATLPGQRLNLLFESVEENNRNWFIILLWYSFVEFIWLSLLIPILKLTHISVKGDKTTMESLTTANTSAKIANLTIITTEEDTLLSPLTSKSSKYDSNFNIPRETLKQKELNA